VYANRAKLAINELMVRLSELEALMRAPITNGKLKRAEGLVMHIARSAPNGQIANLSMQVMSALGQVRSEPAANDTLEKTLSQLRTSLGEAAL
jgi:hypothetical protein